MSKSMYPSNFDEERQYLLARITSPLFLDIKIQSNKYYFTDDLVLNYLPVLQGTLYAKDKGISEKVAESINWIWRKSETLDKLLNDDFRQYIFAEHSSYLLKEHFKMVIRLTTDKIMKKNASIIIKKLDQING